MFCRPVAYESASLRNCAADCCADSMICFDFAWDSFTFFSATCRASTIVFSAADWLCLRMLSASCSALFLMSAAFFSAA